MATRKPKPGPGPAGPQITTVGIDELTPDPANLRRHPERNVRATDASLKRFGAARSIVVDGKNVVRAGNRTLESARAAGVTQVLIVDPDPGQLVVVRRKDWSPSEATAYAIADNRTAELAEWEDTALAETLRALQSEPDFEAESVGYTEGEVDRLCESLAGAIVGDPSKEWEGMPEFQHEDQTSPFRAIVHFASEADMRAFEELVGQKIPANTRSIWHPRAERQVVKGSGYVADEP